MEYRVRVEETHYYVVDAINQKIAKKLIEEHKVEEKREPTRKVFIQENIKNIKFHDAERDNAYDEHTIKRLVGIYRGMVRRCYNVLHQHWDLYGKQRVGICEEWLNDFYSFVDWSLANGYANNLTLDKIDNSKSYSSDNCRWATPKEQANNRKDTGHHIHNGREYTTREIADMYGINRNYLATLLCTGHTLEDAINILKNKKEVEGQIEFKF